MGYTSDADIANEITIWSKKVSKINDGLWWTDFIDFGILLTFSSITFFLIIC